MICGAIEGVFEVMHLNVVCKFTKDTLKEDKTNEIQMEIKGETKEGISSAFET